jgi:hypothetical protein
MSPAPHTHTVIPLTYVQFESQKTLSSLSFLRYTVGVYIAGVTVCRRGLCWRVFIAGLYCRSLQWEWFIHTVHILVRKQDPADDISTSYDTSIITPYKPISLYFPQNFAFLSPFYLSFFPLPLLFKFFSNFPPHSHHLLYFLPQWPCNCVGNN